MAGNKYGKYFLKEPWGIPVRAQPDPNAPVYIGVGQKAPVPGWEPFTQVLRPIYRAFNMVPTPHKHDYAEIIYFIGGDPMNFKEFGAEVEFYMGEEEEKYVITSTTWVYIPGNLLHCPLNFKRVDKPIMFGHIMSAPGYEAKSATGESLSLGRA